MSDDFTLHYSGEDKEEKTERGVEVMVRNNIVKNVVNVNCVREPLVSVELWKTVPADIIVHAKVENTPSEVKKIYDELEDILNQEVKGKVSVMIMGDFNSVIRKAPKEKIARAH